MYIITNVIDVTRLIKTILKQPNRSFKLPKRERNHLIIHIIENFRKFLSVKFNYFADQKLLKYK